MTNLGKGDNARLAVRLYGALTEAGLSPKRTELVVSNEALAARIVQLVDQAALDDDSELPNFEWTEPELDRIIAWAFSGQANHTAMEAGIAGFKRNFASELADLGRINQCTLYLRVQGYSYELIGELADSDNVTVMDTIKASLAYVKDSITRLQRDHDQAA